MKANPIIPLTEEQRQFAAEHEYLIWSFIRWKNLGFGDRERINDWYFVLAESYLNAVRSYKGISTFKVFAYSVMWYSVLAQLQYDRRAKRSGITVGLDEPIGENITLEDILATPGESVENMVVAQLAKEELWTQIRAVLSDEQLEATLLRIRCHGNIEMASQYSNVKKSTFHSRLRQARDNIKEKIWGQPKVCSEAAKEKIAARRKRYQEANKEKDAAHKRAFRAANKEKCAAQSKKYHEANKEKITAQNKARYAKKKALREQELQQGA